MVGPAIRDAGLPIATSPIDEVACTAGVVLGKVETIKEMFPNLDLGKERINSRRNKSLSYFRPIRRHHN